MTDDRREWYIYVLRDPRDNEVRYVGFTVNIKKRFHEHISEATRGIAKSHKARWINVLLNLDLRPIIEVIERGAGEWQSVEQYWIRHYRMQGARLTNATDGGDGTLNPSPETRKKLRQANLGRKHTPEAIEKTRQSNLGRKNSPEHIEKTRQAHLGRKHTPEHIEKNRQANLWRCIPVRRVEDGMIFVSIQEAAHSVDRSESSLRAAIRTRSICAGYHWERVGETPPADPYTLDGNALVMRID